MTTPHETISVEEAAGLLGISRSRAYDLVKNSSLETVVNEHGILRVKPSAIKKFLSERRPFVVLSDSTIDGERCRVALVPGNGRPVVEVRVERGADVETVTFDAQALCHWQVHFPSPNLASKCWRAGVAVPPDPTREPQRIISLPIVLSESRIEDSVRVSIVDLDGQVRAQVSVDHGANEKSVCFNTAHLNEWRTAMRSALRAAWSCGAVSDATLASVA